MRDGNAEKAETPGGRRGMRWRGWTWAMLKSRLHYEDSTRLLILRQRFRLPLFRLV